MNRHNYVYLLIKKNYGKKLYIKKRYKTNAQVIHILNGGV